MGGTTCHGLGSKHTQGGISVVCDSSGTMGIFGGPFPVTVMAGFGRSKGQ